MHLRWGLCHNLNCLVLHYCFLPVVEFCSSQNHTADVPGTQVLVTQTQPTHPWVALRFWCLCPALFLFISLLRPPRVSCAPLPETHFVSAPFLLVPNPAPQVEALGWGMARTEVLQFLYFIFILQSDAAGLGLLEASSCFSQGLATGAEPTH